MKTWSLDEHPKVIDGILTVKCPNPECDEFEGCCLCEHTGRVYMELFIIADLINAVNAGLIATPVNA